MFGSKRGEIIRAWKNLHNKEVHILYSSPSVIRMIKSSRIRWVGHIALMVRNPYRVFCGKDRRKGATVKT
jgi:hypothetical protein